MVKPNLKGFTLEELQEFALSIGEKKFRGGQLFQWLYSKECKSFEEMTSLSKSFREKLARSATVDSLKLVKLQQSPNDGTQKFLFELADGKRIESVLIPPRTAFQSPEARVEDEQRRLTLCVSTQVGCPLDCKFCATASMGYHRNLTAGEIVDQVIQVKKISGKPAAVPDNRTRAGKRITNLVYMGMGEPLMNYDNLMKSIEIFSTGMEIAARRITISTAGWAPKIRQMADEKRKVKLAVSLHSLDEKIREKLMPINKKFDLAELIDAVQYYYKKTKARVTFEYILFDGLNDRDEDIRHLISLSKKIPCKFNIIPFHAIEFTYPTGIASHLRLTPKDRKEEFVRKLRNAHITIFVRSSAGEDIDAACGQLAVKTDRQRPPEHLPLKHNSLITNLQDV